MKGYERPETVYRLQFEGRDGLEVRAASVPLGTLLDVADSAGALKSGKADGFDEVREVLDLFSSRLRSWNLTEKDGAPIPATREALLSMEFGFVVELLMAWFDAIGGVPAPLEPRSTDGLPSEVLQMEMESLSSSLLS